jgi:cell division protein FtsA
MSRKGNNVVVGLDLGSTKTCAIVGEVQVDGVIDVIGVGTAPSRGVKRGVVVNIDSTVEAIRQAVEEAQIMAGVDVSSVYVGIAGGHMTGLNSIGIIPIKNQEITAREVEKVIEAARIVALPVDREVMHVLPQEYIVDDQRGILEPIGMSGVRLEAKVHIVTAAMTAAHNIVKCVNKAGLEVADIVLEQLAAGEAVLSPEERDLGTMVIDIGGGRTNVAVLAGNSVKHTLCLDVGGNHITNDLAFGLNVSIPEAERLKKAHGCAFSGSIESYEVVELRRIGEREPQKRPRQELCDIIEPRLDEMLQMVREEIIRSGYAKSIPGGIVLTGGTAMLQGITELAEDLFRLPVRCGIPTGIGGLVEMVHSPMYATSVGLLQFGIRHHRYGHFQKFANGHLFGKTYHRMRNWFQEFLA